MDLNQHSINKIAQALRSKKNSLNQSQFAAALGKSRSWASRLLGGEVKAVTDAEAIAIEELLDIRFVTAPLKAEAGWSKTTAKVAKMMEEKSDFRELVELALSQAEERGHIFEMPWFETKELIKIGGEIEAIALANAGKHGAIGHRAIDFLSQFCAKKVAKRGAKP